MKILTPGMNMIEMPTRLEMPKNKKLPKQVIELHSFSIQSTIFKFVCLPHTWTTTKIIMYIASTSTCKSVDEFIYTIKSASSQDTVFLGYYAICIDINNGLPLPHYHNQLRSIIIPVIFALNPVTQIMYPIYLW